MTDRVSRGPARDLAGYRGRPPLVTWPDGARLAVAGQGA
jgi:hypothetical protein